MKKFKYKHFKHTGVYLMIEKIDTFGGTQTLPFRVGKIQVPLSINPACRQA
jgi:hypothetical protein